MKVDKIKTYYFYQPKLFDWLRNLIRGYKRFDQSQIELSFSDPKNENKIILGTGKIIGKFKLLKQIEEAFTQGQLYISIQTPEENNLYKMSGGEVLDIESFKEAAEEVLKKNKDTDYGLGPGVTATFLPRLYYAD